jgi:hypothetical protein
MQPSSQLKWKPDWTACKENLNRWWNRKGLALGIFVGKCPPVESVPPVPPAPPDLTTKWTDPTYRRLRSENDLARTRFLGEAFPVLDCDIGPGSLGAMLGATMHFEPTTVWYDPCITDADLDRPIRFDRRDNANLQRHLGLLEDGLAHARGRYLVGMPDLIENIDTLAAMRGTETLLIDMIERPDWVCERVSEINDAYFEAFDLIYDRIRLDDASSVFNAFGIWGPGRTAKLQCDYSCMISPDMFERFVAPAMTRQCQWLDHSIYHLDGTTALQHVDGLLAIEPLDAIEWTPQAGQPSAGDPCWYDLYRRIKRGGKSVQAPWCEPQHVLPLIEAVGPDAMFITTYTDSMEAARKMLDKVAAYRV